MLQESGRAANVAVIGLGAQLYAAAIGLQQPGIDDAAVVRAQADRDLCQPVTEEIQGYLARGGQRHGAAVGGDAARVPDEPTEQRDGSAGPRGQRA